METNVIPLPRKKPLDLNDLNKLLKLLRERDQLVPNPLLKDWFTLKNQIRQIEQTIKQIKK